MWDVYELYEQICMNKSESNVWTNLKVEFEWIFNIMWSIKLKDLSF